MDRFQEMQVFIRIAERSSFTQAADDLQIPRATVTNLLKRMEERLGTRLLERTTRTVRLTHDGEAFYRRCVRLVADMEEAEGSFRNVAPKGLLRVNLQGTLARHFVVPALPEFHAQYPEHELPHGGGERVGGPGGEGGGGWPGFWWGRRCLGSSRGIRISNCRLARTTGWWISCARGSTACCGRGRCRIRRWSDAASR